MQVYSVIYLNIYRQYFGMSPTIGSHRLPTQLPSYFKIKNLT